MSTTKYDVIVVGAGFGGSACAALLAKRGMRVLLVDKNARAGGKAMTLTKKGYTHTAWVVISAPVQGTLLQTVLQELGKQDAVELLTLPGQQAIIYRTASGKYKRMAARPETTMDPNVVFDWLEVKDQDRAESLRCMMELTLMSPQDINILNDISFDEWLHRYNLPKAVYAFLVGPVVDGCFVVPVDVLSASEAITTLQGVFLRGGGLFCRGGFGKLADTYAQSVAENGGKVLMRTRVENILVEHGKATGVVTDKGTFQAPIVISNAGLQPTVLKLVGEEHFDRSYVNYVKDLLPSLGFMGTRYFLSKPVTDAPYGVIFSDETPWSLQRWLREAKLLKSPAEMTVWFEVPSNYDPQAAPPGKQILMTGYLCPADPQMSAREKKAWWDRGEEILFRVFPDLPKYVEAKEGYSTRDVSRLTRDQVLPRQGGECIGLAQIVGQAGSHKPSPKAPIQGLFYVGCDAGGHGVGIHQAVDSAMKVAQLVIKYHMMRQGLA
jgi:phytoene dehydrogenase-like protein